MSSLLSHDQRKALVRQYLETAWNTPILEHTQQDKPSSEDDGSIAEGPACVYLGAERLSTSLAQVRQTVRASFPDLRFTILDLVAEGETVVVRWLIQGTDLGGCEGYPPTGRSIRLTGITLLRLEDHRIVEEWNEVDVAGMLRQLGFVYTPQPPRVTVRRSGPINRFPL